MVHNQTVSTMTNKEGIVTKGDKNNAHDDLLIGLL